MGIPIDQTWLEVLLLATVRMTAFLIVAPPFAHQAFPGRIKAMLGVGLGLAVSQRLSAGYVARDTAGFLTGVVLELVTGLVL
ncbi:flagellar biosynthetic protein FliR, partial [Paenarthrobacter sp. RAF9]